MTIPVSLFLRKTIKYSVAEESQLCYPQPEGSPQEPVVCGESMTCGLNL
jgi:hypothetical protein